MHRTATRLEPDVNCAGRWPRASSTGFSTRAWASGGTMPCWPALRTGATWRSGCVVRMRPAGGSGRSRPGSPAGGSALQALCRARIATARGAAANAKHLSRCPSPMDRPERVRSADSRACSGSETRRIASAQPASPGGERARLGRPPSCPPQAAMGSHVLRNLLLHKSGSCRVDVPAHRSLGACPSGRTAAGSRASPGRAHKCAGVAPCRRPESGLEGRAPCTVARRSGRPADPHPV